MVFPETIRDTIAMMRRRVIEIDSLIERIERERTVLHQVGKKDAPRSLQTYAKRGRSGG
jgi:hypothetical protein